MTAGDLFFAEKEVEHQGFVVNLILLRDILRIFPDPPLNLDLAYVVEVYGVVENEPGHPSLSFERKNVVIDR
jgi:hypothetical protein